MNNKGQLSIEFIIIIGVVLLAVVILTIFYLSSVSKNIDKSSISLEEVEMLDDLKFRESPDILDYTLNTCGNGIIEPTEVCDSNGPIYSQSISSCADLGLEGTLSCSGCQITGCTKPEPEEP